MPIPSFDAIRQYALSLEWSDAGVTRAALSREDILSYEDWLGKGYHGKLSYMENPVRPSIQDFFPGARSALIFVSYYKQKRLDPTAHPGLVASYARGRDYHHVHRKRLKKMAAWLEEQVGEKGTTKSFSDSSPILEKALAVQAGLGWFGKNTLFIHRRLGTFVLLSGILTKFSVPEEKMELRLPRCGVCTRCMDACPTQALVEPYLLDATRCLSYHLIESKEEIPEEIRKKNPGYIFGCDICQDVCPHNVRKPESEAPEFRPESGLGPVLDEEALKKVEEDPEKLFGTPLQRRKAQGLRYNWEQMKRGENFNNDVLRRSHSEPH